MSTTATAATTDVSGPVIHAYSRRDAIRDGALVDVTATARENGITMPVALTSGAWADVVAWDEADNDRKGTAQSETGRLHDVLSIAFWALAANRNRLAAAGIRIQMPMVRTPRAGRGAVPRRVVLHMVAGVGDDGSAVVTIMGADEDAR